MKLGKFKQVPLREIWQHEALDFTNWLAQEDNLELLGEELEISIVNAQTEVNVGKFAVDILAEDENGHKLIIENQLETTNHDHLGKTITYAAGLQAETIVWIVKNAREEHEQAVNWLNENTNEKVNFFLIEIQAWKIDESSPAPRFNIIAKPNDWAKTIKQSTGLNSLSDLKIQQQDFWNRLKEYGEEHSNTSWQKARPQHWYDKSIGTSRAHISFTVNTRKNQVAVDIYIPDDMELYNKLFENKEIIESKLGYRLIWAELQNRKASAIGIIRKGNFQDETQVQDLVEWLFQRAEDFTKVFKKYL